jgi:hypothetical protein
MTDAATETAATELARQPHWRDRVVAAVNKARSAMKKHATHPSQPTCGMYGILVRKGDHRHE